MLRMNPYTPSMLHTKYATRDWPWNQTDHRTDWRPRSSHLQAKMLKCAPPSTKGLHANDFVLWVLFHARLQLQVHIAKSPRVFIFSAWASVSRKRAEYGFGEHGFKHRTQWVFWGSLSSGERTQWVPLGLLFECKRELTEFFRRTHRVCPKTQWVLFSETVLSKQYSARFLVSPRCVAMKWSIATTDRLFGESCLLPGHKPHQIVIMYTYPFWLPTGILAISFGKGPPPCLRIHWAILAMGVEKLKYLHHFGWIQSCFGDIWADLNLLRLDCFLKHLTI